MFTNTVSSYDSTGNRSSVSHDDSHSPSSVKYGNEMIPWHLYGLFLQQTKAMLSNNNEEEEKDQKLFDFPIDYSLKNYASPVSSVSSAMSKVNEMESQNMLLSTSPHSYDDESGKVLCLIFTRCCNERMGAILGHCEI